MKRTLILMVMVLSLFAIAGCSTATAEQPREYTFTYVHDWSEPKEPQGAVRIMQEMNARANETAHEATTEEEAATIPVYEDSGSYSGYNDTLNNNPAYIDGGHDHWLKYAGVASDDKYSYTYYQQSVLPGGGLDELNENGRHVDEETGFIKDGDGYIAIAMDGVEKLTVVDTMFGPAKVYDRMSGEDAPYTGEIDVYTDF